MHFLGSRFVEYSDVGTWNVTYSRPADVDSHMVVHSSAALVDLIFRRLNDISDAIQSSSLSQSENEDETYYLIVIVLVQVDITHLEGDIKSLQMLHTITMNG